MRKTKNSYLSNLDTKKITESITFWKKVVPLFTSKPSKSENIIIIEGDKSISHEKTFVKYLTIVYKKKDEWYIEWQLVTTNDNEWQRMTTSDNKWYNEWQRVTASDTTSDNEWQQIAMSDSEWQQWYNEWKRHSTLQRMDDCRVFNDKNRYTTTSRDGWLQLEWLNK